MLNKNNMYKKIIDLLINIFKSNQLKKSIIEIEKIRKNVVLQINNLLYLEKQHNCTVNSSCYAVEFAQCLVNLTEKQELIGKDDQNSIEKIKKDYLFLLDHLSQAYGQDKQKLVAIDSVDISLIKDLWQVEEVSIEKSDSIHPVFMGIKTNENESNENQTQIHNFNQNYQAENREILQKKMQILKFNDSLPLHPKVDPRFYPFKTKSKRMPMFKIILTILMSINFILAAFITCYAIVKHVEIDKNLMADSFNELWIHKKNDEVLFTMPMDVDSYTHYHGLSDENLKIELEIFFAFAPLVFILIVLVFCCFHLLENQTKSRNKYSINWYNIMILYPIVLLPLFYFVIKYNINHFELTAGKIAENELAEKFNAWCNNIINKSIQIRTIFYLTIASSIITTITFAFLVYLTCINPRIDKNKVQKADLEYKKMIDYAYQGKQYSFDKDLLED